MNRRSGLVAMVIVCMIAGGGCIFAFTTPATNTPGIVPSREILDMKYFSDLSASERDRAPDLSGLLSEYALITVDPVALMHDADTDHEVFVGIRGTPFRKEAQFRIHLVSVPPPISPDAVLVIENESGEFVEPLPLIKQYKGVVMGRVPGEAFFTVSDDVILGKMSVNGKDYYLEQRGPGQADGGNVIHVLYRSDKTIPFQGPPEEFDTHLLAGWSIVNLDANRCHTVHIRLSNATHLVGDEEIELVAGNSSYPALFSNLKAGTYSARFTVDGNHTSEIEMIDAYGIVFSIHPNRTVTQDERIFTG